MQIKDRLKKEPDIFLKLAESSLVVAKSLRSNYLDITVKLAERIRDFLLTGQTSLVISQVDEPLLNRSLTVCFVDGGIGEADIFFRVPFIVRGGIFRVKESERDIERRETFEFFPVLVGNLEGGEKSRSDYTSVVRIIVELAAVKHILDDEKYQDVDMIILHGPLLYRLSAYTDHWFYEADMEHMAVDAEALIDGYKEFCRSDPEPRSWFNVWSKEKKIRAVYMIAYLLKSIIDQCIYKKIHVIGAVEKASATELCRYLFSELLNKGLLRETPFWDYFDLDTGAQHSWNADRIIDKGNYNDPLLFALVLEPGEYLNFWEAQERYSGFSEVGEIKGFGNWLRSLVPISYTYLKPAENSFALRIEFPTYMTQEKQASEILGKVCQYSRLLPTYVFPLGLDIVDKFARVPKWMVDAYRKYILFNFGRLPEDEHLDHTELERLLLFYYFHQRAFLTRPKP